MSSAGLPEELINYYQGFIDWLDNAFKHQLFRYGSPNESAYWVAYEGFNIAKSEYQKLSMTLSPVLFTAFLPGARAILIGFGDWIYEDARAVPYTYSRDPLTLDPLYPYEFELAIYYKPAQGYSTSFLDVGNVNYARLIRGVNMSTSDYKKAKVLPYFKHGRAYGRYPSSLLDDGSLAQFLAVTSVLQYDSKMEMVFDYAWDKYWADRNKIAREPEYAHAIYGYALTTYRTYYTDESIYYICSKSMVPSHKCEEIYSDIVRRIKYIYGLVGVEVDIYIGESAMPERQASSKAYVLYNMFPDLFSSPQEAESTLKWWHEDFDSLVRYLNKYRERRYEPKMSVDQDPEAVIED
jgi:hypothetical protein